MSGAGKEQCGTPEEFRTADELASLVTVCAQGSPAATDARFAAGPSDGGWAGDVRTLCHHDF